VADRLDLGCVTEFGPPPVSLQPFERRHG
jgi:hypothetical protein